VLKHNSMKVYTEGWDVNLPAVKCSAVYESSLCGKRHVQAGLSYGKDNIGIHLTDPGLSPRAGLKVVTK